MHTAQPLSTTISYLYYRVNGRPHRGYTIDSCDDTGQRIDTVACYFKTREKAETRLAELVAANNAAAKPVELGRQTPNPFFFLLQSCRFDGARGEQVQ